MIDRTKTFFMDQEVKVSGKTDLQTDNEGKYIINLPEDFPLRVDTYRFNLDSRLTQNYHDCLELAYLYRGSGTFLIGEKELRGNEGDLFVINNVELHTFLNNFKDNLMVLAIHFLPELIYKPGDNGICLEYLKPFYCRSDRFNNLIPRKIVEQRGISKLLQKIMDEVKNKKDLYKLATRTYLQEVLLKLLYHYSTMDSQLNSDDSYNKKLADIDKLKATFILLTNNYNKNISLDDAASSAYMSPHYFCRFFKKVTGTTFKEYLLRIRIDKAKELLLKYNMSVTEIAYQVGFKNLSYFFRVFKRITTLNPMEFRKLAGSISSNLLEQGL